FSLLAPVRFRPSGAKKPSRIAASPNRSQRRTKSLAQKEPNCGCTRDQNPKETGAESRARERHRRSQEAGPAAVARRSPLGEGRGDGRAAAGTEERSHGRRGEGVQPID